MMTRRPASTSGLDRIAMETLLALSRGETMPYHGRDYGPVAQAHRKLWEMKLISLEAASHRTRVRLSPEGEKFVAELRSKSQ
jgi:hypothetical protein